MPFALHAGAAGDPAYAPIITKQPKEQVTIFTGKDLVLDVEAELPDGVEGTLSYEWYYRNDEVGRKEVGTGAKLVFPITKDIVPNRYTQLEHKFFAVVTNTYIDAEGQEQTASIQSNFCLVNTSLRPVETLSKDLRYLFVEGDLVWMLLMHPELLIGLLFTPISYPIHFIRFFFNSLIYR